MLDSFFQPIFTDSFTLGNYLLSTLISLFLGVVVAIAAAWRNRVSKSFLLALVMLPAIVQTVIMMVNGSIGTGVAVMGAFSLVRFRSVPGSAREIVCIFLSMAIGLATATGYLGIAVLFTCIMSAALLAAVLFHLSGESANQRDLKITVPESLNYAHAFDQLFAEYTRKAILLRAKTTNMGSLYKLFYRIELKEPEREQEFIDQLRCRNGNLEIALGYAAEGKDEL